MKRNILVVIAALVVTTVAAWAASEKTDPDGSAFPRWFRSLYIGPNTTRNPTLNVQNKITASCATTLDYDFPSVRDGYCVSNTDKSFTGTALGGCNGVAKLGDPCFIGVAAATPSDAGSAYIPYARPQCIVRKDSLIEIWVCPQQSDGGQEDLPDAGYNVRVFSNQ